MFYSEMRRHQYRMWNLLLNDFLYVTGRHSLLHTMLQEVKTNIATSLICEKTESIGHSFRQYNLLDDTRLQSALEYKKSIRR